MDRLSDYDYELPESLIAQTPLEDRSASRLLWLHRDTGLVEHRQFVDVVQILKPGDLLVVNDTKVTALRLFGQKQTGGKVEALLLRELKAGVYQALLKPGKRLKVGSELLFEDGLRARVVEDFESEKVIEFAGSDVGARLEEIGQVPLPPYIHAKLDQPERYQTVYAGPGGSAAAPTAGLHFTPEVLRKLAAGGVGLAKVTLDVGLDTFRPVQSETLEDHEMHGEVCAVPPTTAELIAGAKGRIIAVGTTTVRTLESAAIGYRRVEIGSQWTKIFIRPGFKFQVVEGMFTNFHLPRTTMLMMISAMAGRDRIMASYAEAIDKQYRFLSFGDSMLIL